MKLAKVLRLRKGSAATAASDSSSPPSGASSPTLLSPSSLPKALSPLRRSAGVSVPSSPAKYGESSTKSGSFGGGELESVFRFIDSNRDGKISIEELQAVLRSLGDDPTPEELERMVAEADTDGDGFISLDEFLSMNNTSINPTSVAELRAAFHVFDRDGNGYITPEELHGVLVSLGDKGLTMQECRRMIRGVDADGDGLVDFEEFKLMMLLPAAATA